MTARPDFVYQREMGFTRGELLRGLETAVLPYKIVDLNANKVEIVAENRMVKLTTGPDSFRKIASMKIPLLSVKLEFYNFGQQQFDQFLNRFRRYLHKGGG